MSPAEWCIFLRTGYIPNEDKSTAPISKFKMLKLKLQYFDHLMWRTDSLEKTLMLGKTEARRGREWQRMRWQDGSGSWRWTVKLCVLQSMGSQRVRHDWGTELNWARIRWPKNWSFSFNISPSNDYSGLIPFRIDWLDLFAIQGTLKSLLQHHSSKTSILWCSTFFMVQLSHPYMTTGKTIALTRQTFVSKVMSLLFNMLSRLVIAFLPRSNCL